jgi:peptide deformylase
MLATLEDSHGIGTAAPQVCESAARFIVASSPKPRDPTAPLMGPEIVIDPEIIARSDELVKDREGCLRLPGLRGLVPCRRRIDAESGRRGAGRPARVRRRRGADLARWNAGGIMGPFERMDRP